MDYSMPDPCIFHYPLEFAHTHVDLWVMLSKCHLLMPLSPPAFNHSQHQGLFQWVGYLHQMTKVLELQLQHQSFQWIFRVNFYWLVLFPYNKEILLDHQGTLKSLLQHHNSNTSHLWYSTFFMVQISHLYMTTEKNHSFDYMDFSKQSDGSVF